MRTVNDFDNHFHLKCYLFTNNSMTWIKPWIKSTEKRVIPNLLLLLFSDLRILIVQV